MARAKDVRGQFPVINLGGKPRTIKYDLNAFAEMEKRYGSVDAAMTALKDGSMLNLRMILWIGLIHEEAVLDPDTGDVIKYNITPYQVGSWISPADIPMISEKIGLAIGGSMPDIKDVPEAVAKLKEMGYELDGEGHIVEAKNG